eukprot:CAMPEP_0114972122 /NCGR_PEP_ID=MMETSP0216-20121206/222_1 /TAXON_ID=223996 /ORGANISM="Protocruzia adherens, Strain Boccale" /LENGTH=68 /DNA_ID=CAMNT_0002332465 /DNA_START=161 /DNA_END=367 /DNA_ORIENTATION=+
MESNLYGGGFGAMANHNTNPLLRKGSTDSDGGVQPSHNANRDWMRRGSGSGSPIYGVTNKMQVQPKLN